MGRILGASKHPKRISVEFDGGKRWDLYPDEICRAAEWVTKSAKYNIMVYFPLYIITELLRMVYSGQYKSNTIC